MQKSSPKNEAGKVVKLQTLMKNNDLPESWYKAIGLMKKKSASLYVHARKVRKEWDR